MIRITKDLNGEVMKTGDPERTDENLLKKQRIEPLLQEAKELTAIFMASRKTARKLNTEDRKG